MMRGVKLRSPWMTPYRLTPSTQFQVSRSISHVRPAAGHPGVVAGQVELTELADDALGEGLDLGAVADIGRHRDGIRRPRRRTISAVSSQRPDLDVGQCQVHPLGRERHGHRPTDARGRPGDHADLSLQFFHRCNLPQQFGPRAGRASSSQPRV